MEAIIENNNYFSNLDFFHNLRDHSKKDLKIMNVKKVRDRGDILSFKHLSKIVTSKLKSGIPERKISDVFGTDIPVPNYIEKVMGFYGFVLHHFERINPKDVQKQFISNNMRLYNQLLKDQSNPNILRSEFIRKLEDFSRSFLTPSMKGAISINFGNEAIKADSLDAIIPPRLRDLKRSEELKEGKAKGRKVLKELGEERVKRNQLQNILNNLTNENKRQKEQQPLFKEEKKIIPEVKKIIKEDAILKALREQKNAGTVATLSGFLGITTASIIARIVGNSTANLISSPHKSSGNLVIGDKKDARRKLIELIEKERTIDNERLKNDIDHLRNQIDNRKNIKNIDKRQKNKMKRSKKHTRFNRNEIQLINVINRM